MTAQTIDTRSALVDALEATNAFLRHARMFPIKQKEVEALQAIINAALAGVAEAK